MLIATTPPGATLRIRGEDTEPQTTPAILMRAPDEQFEIEVERKGYETRRRKVTMPSSGQSAKIEFALEPLDVKLKIAIVPKGADVTVDGEKYTGAMTVTPAREVRVEVKIEGYAPVTKTVVAVAGEPLVLGIELDKADTPVPPDSETPEATPPKKKDKTKTKPPTKSGRNGRTKSARDARDKRSEARAAMGTFKVTSAPWWGEVIVDGKPLEETTPVQTKLSVGKHSVIVRHPPKGVKKAFTITIKANKTVKRHVQFE